MARAPASRPSGGNRPPTDRDLRRLYERCVLPDMLAGVKPATRPVAMLVSGQPGAGLAFASVQLRQQLAETASTVAHVSMNRLRAYHPLWSKGEDLSLADAARVSEDCQGWFAHLTKDAQKRDVNLLAEIETTDLETVPTLASELRRSGYAVQAVFVATTREDSRQAMMARYEMRRRVGLGTEPPSAQAHDLAFRSISNVLGRLEHDKAVDGLRVITAHGHQLYESRVKDGGLSRLPRAAETLTAQIEKAAPPKDRVRFTMRWETLVQRLANDPSVPRDVASQVLVWRNEAVARCEAEPGTSKALQWAREAGAFRVMERTEFLRQFPQHQRVVDMLALAVHEAERLAPDQAGSFVAHARENIAQRIERGDMARIAARKVQSKAPDGSAPAQSAPVRNPREPEPPTQ